MKITLLVLSIFLLTFKIHAQTDSTNNSIAKSMFPKKSQSDSEKINSILLKTNDLSFKYDNLKKDYDFRRLKMLEAGKQIEGGAICIGVSMVLGLVGGLVTLIPDRNAPYNVTRLGFNRPQIAGITIGCIGGVVWTAGIIKIGVGGNKLKWANSNLKEKVKNLHNMNNPTDRQPKDDYTDLFAPYN